jgi:four helix bundle protein
MKLRTKKFSLMVIDLAEKLPTTYIVKVVANQIVRSGTSVGANYRQFAEQEVIENLYLK